MIQIKKREKQLLIKFNGNKFNNILNFIKENNCKYLPNEKAWVTTDFTGNITEFIENLKNIDKSIQIDNDVFEKKENIIINYNSELDDSNIDIKDLKNELYPHQKGDVRFFIYNPRCLLANEPGLGKSISAISSVLKLYQLEQIKKVLIVSPSPIIPEWIFMIEKHTYFKCNDIRNTRNYETNDLFNIISLDMLNADFTQDLRKVKATKKKSIEKKKEEIENRKIKNKEAISKYDLIIIDEVHKAVNRTNRLKACRYITNKVKRCWLMSGTPLQNKLVELYTMFTSYISKDFMSYTYFIQRFCIKGGYMNKEIIGYKNVLQFSKMIAPFIRRITKKSLGDTFVKKHEFRHWLPMSTEQNKIYNKVKEQVIELRNDPTKEKKIRIAQEMVLCGYLKQVCNSAYEIDENAKTSSKIDYIEELINEWNEKVLIYSFYKKTSKLLYDRLSKKYNCLIFNGDNSKQLKEAKEWFRKDGNNIFIMSKVGTEGLNFEFCKKMIFLSLDYNPATIQQIQDRIHRLNSKEDVEIHYLIHENTYEEKIVKILDEKRNLQESVIERLSSLKPKEKDLILENI